MPHLAELEVWDFYYIEGYVGLAIPVVSPIHETNKNTIAQSITITVIPTNPQIIKFFPSFRFSSSPAAVTNFTTPQRNTTTAKPISNGTNPVKTLWILIIESVNQGVTIAADAKSGRTKMPNG